MAYKIEYVRCNNPTCKLCSVSPTVRPHGPYVYEMTYIGQTVSKSGNIRPKYRQRYIGRATEVDVCLTDVKLPKPKWELCAWCGKPFKQKVNWQSYCRKNCRIMAYQKRRRQFKEDYERVNNEVTTQQPDTPTGETI